jgi:hypothetical protein
MMYKYIIAFGVCLLLVVGLAPQGQCQACRSKFSIDYVGMWSEYYNACNSEMKTTFDYEIWQDGNYPVIWAQVDNTPFSVEYWAGVLCPSPPCQSSVIAWNHCNTLTNHRLIMDVLTGTETIGFVDQKLTAEYFASKPD